MVKDEEKTGLGHIPTIRQLSPISRRIYVIAARLGVTLPMVVITTSHAS